MSYSIPMTTRGPYLRPSAAWRQDLARLAARGLSHSRIAAFLSREYRRPVTRWHVRYYLHEDDRLAQDGECVPRDPFDLHHRRAVYQLQKGFGHLLPDVLLRHRETDILVLLRERGPLSRDAIAQALGVRSLIARHQRWLSRLQQRGLVRLVFTRHRPGLYQIHTG